jgi:hypothetical protein
LLPEPFDKSRAKPEAYTPDAQETVAELLGFIPMKKPSKTAAELEAAIKVEMEDICEWPTDIAVSVLPEGDSWKVAIIQEKSSAGEWLPPGLFACSGAGVRVSTVAVAVALAFSHRALLGPDPLSTTIGTGLERLDLENTLHLLAQPRLVTLCAPIR